MSQLHLPIAILALGLSSPSLALGSKDTPPNPDDWADYTPIPNLDWESQSTRRATFMPQDVGAISIELQVDYKERVVLIRVKDQRWRRSGNTSGGLSSKTMSGSAPLERWNDLIALDQTIFPQQTRFIVEPDPDFIPSTRDCFFDELYIEASNGNGEFWRRAVDECNQDDRVSAYFDKMVEIALSALEECDRYATLTDTRKALFNCIGDFGQSDQ